MFGISFEWPLKTAFTVFADIYTSDELRHFRLEIDAMKSLGTHPHLVSIIGCCSGPIYCLLMDYCALGDLKNYLRKYREKVRRAAMCGSRGGQGAEPPPPPTEKYKNIGFLSFKGLDPQKKSQSF